MPGHPVMTAGLDKIVATFVDTMEGMLASVGGAPGANVWVVRVSVPRGHLVLMGFESLKSNPVRFAPTQVALHAHPSAYPTRRFLLSHARPSKTQNL